MTMEKYNQSKKLSIDNKHTGLDQVGNIKMLLKDDYWNEVLELTSALESDPPYNQINRKHRTKKFQERYDGTGVNYTNVKNAVMRGKLLALDELVDRLNQERSQEVVNRGELITILNEMCKIMETPSLKIENSRKQETRAT